MLVFNLVVGDSTLDFFGCRNKTRVKVEEKNKQGRLKEGEGIVFFFYFHLWELKDSKFRVEGK